MLPLNSKQRRDAVMASLYFLGSTLITWWFIMAGKGLYEDTRKMLLSCGIAGAKWAVQIGAALWMLREQAWGFVRRIGMTCLVGSLILLPFCFEPVQEVLGLRGFLMSLAVCVAAMIALYYWNVRRSGLSTKWFWGWIACLMIAITLQLTVVFHVV
jgi:hypothetical protein